MPVFVSMVVTQLFEQVVVEMCLACTIGEIEMAVKNEKLINDVTAIFLIFDFS